MKYLLLVAILLFTSTMQMHATPDGNANSAEAAELIAKSKEIVYTNPEQAAYYATKATQLLSIEEKIGQKSDQKADALMAYSFAARLLGNFDSSIKSLFDALEYVTPSNLVLTGKIYSLMGVVYCVL